MTTPVDCSVTVDGNNAYVLTYGELNPGTKNQDPKLDPQNDGGSVIVKFTCGDLYHNSTKIPQAKWNGFKQGDLSPRGKFWCYKLTWKEGSDPMPTWQEMEKYFP